jgi:glutathione S-transferase
MIEVVLYGDKKTTCTQRILILLEELNLKYDFSNVDLKKGEQKTQEFLELQPFGKVPAISYGDRKLFESRCILRYIAKNNVEFEDLLGDAEVDLWLEVESQNFNPHASKIVYEKVFKKMMGQDCDEKIVDSSVVELEKVLDVYEKRLQNYPYIGGKVFSIADISHIPYTNHLLRCGFKEQFKSRPNVYKWVKRIMKRDSVENVLKQTSGS